MKILFVTIVIKTAVASGMFSHSHAVYFLIHTDQVRRLQSQSVAEPEKLLCLGSTVLEGDFSFISAKIFFQSRAAWDSNMWLI
jgi:hypothetical protein